VAGAAGILERRGIGTWQLCIVRMHGDANRAAGPPKLSLGHVCSQKQAMHFRGLAYSVSMSDWGFLTNHGRALLSIAHDPGIRLSDIAAGLGITERSAHTIVSDLAQAGYVVKQKDGRRNRYEIQAHLPLAEPGTREPPIGDILAVLVGDPGSIAPPNRPGSARPHVRRPG
jgi:hypothetical protein